MAHARLSDVIVMLLALGAGAGVYYFFVFFRLETLGTVFGIIAFFSVCFLDFYIPILIKKKKRERKGKQYTIPRPQIQERQERTSFEEFKYCIKCGSEMKKEVKICTKCGQPFEV